MPTSANIARYLSDMSARQPNVAALKVPRGRDRAGRIRYLTLSFAELDAEVAAWCAEFRRRDVQPGDRVLVMVRQGLPLIASAFALFSHGAVPVVIDPGMGMKSFLACVQSAQPRALLGIPAARVLSHVFRKAFRSVAVRVPASGSPLARRVIAAAPGVAGRERTEVVFREATDLAAVLFTSGSTGAPKGVCYEHGMFEAQVRLIRKTYDIQPGEIDLPMLPIFALFNPALGMTTVVPEIDPSKPARVDPARIVQAIQQEQVTNSFGSPTLWNKIAQFCIQNRVTLPSLRRVLCAGAPVPASLWESSRAFLTAGMLHSPYGATESLPVSTIAAAQVDAASMRGAPVGRVVEGMQVKVIALSEGPIGSIEGVRELPRGAVGELIVRGPVVTKAYDALPEATAAAKISDGNGCWHRLGDCGYFDAEESLWFCGRKVERVRTPSGDLHTEPCEQVFRSHPAVERCALIGLGEAGRQEPALVVQRKKGQLEPSDERLAGELRERAKLHPHTAAITRFYFHPNFPVDVRHNAKIHRLTLAKWASSATGYEAE